MHIPYDKGPIHSHNIVKGVGEHTRKAHRPQVTRGCRERGGCQAPLRNPPSHGTRGLAPTPFTDFYSNQPSWNNIVQVYGAL